MPAPQTEHGELRRAQRLDHPGAGPRHHGAGVVPGRRVGVRLHRFRQSGRDRVSSIAVRSTPKQLITGGYWSTYWYNGNIYGAEIARGIDIFRLTPSEHLSQNEIDAATLGAHDEFNAQQQPRVTWPATFIVARAYLDQLDAQQGAAGAIAIAAMQERDRSCRSRSTRPRGDLDQLDTLADSSRQDASARDRPRRRCACGAGGDDQGPRRRGCGRRCNMREASNYATSSDWIRCTAAALSAVDSALAVGHAGRRAGDVGDQTDPRVGLKAGFRDAGVAARNMELLANLPKPEGFFDPEAPAGAVERRRSRRRCRAHRQRPAADRPEGDAG